MKILVSWSTGKDSGWMLHVLQQRHPGCVAGLLTSMNETVRRVSMHGVREDVLRAQAAAANLPLYTIPLPYPCTNEIYERRLKDAVGNAVQEAFTHVAFGDLFLEDVRRYREERMAGTGLEPLFPLWGLPTDRLVRDMIAGGLEARITCLNPAVMPREFAGRRLRDVLDVLPEGVDPCGERGEFHTCVTAGPMFVAPLAVETGEVVERDGFVFADLMLVSSA
jgi:uncharacterized protein (TIGR00290 family)